MFHQYGEAAALVAKLFSEPHLDSEEGTKKHLLPVLKTLATTEFGQFKDVAMYMLRLLLNKMPENGISLLTAVLPIKVYNYTKSYIRMIRCPGLHLGGGGQDGPSPPPPPPLEKLLPP